MTKIRDELINTLWRGNDPFLGGIRYDGPADLQGWSSQHPYLAEAIESLRPRITVEIGVWKGGSTLHMAQRLRDLAIDGVVIAIDTWLGAWDHWVQDRWFAELGTSHGAPSLFDKFINNVRQTGLCDYVVPIPLDSINAAEVLRHFNIRPDLVHIDAGHDYEAVRNDLQQWWPALRPGGILIGDDYREGNDWPGVKRAFDTYFLPLGLTPIENISDKCRLTKPSNEVASSAGDGQNFERIAASVNRWREECRIEFTELVESDAVALPDLIRRYIAFSGPNWDGMRFAIMDKITEGLNKAGIICERSELFDPEGGFRDGALGHSFAPLVDQYLQPQTADKFERFELLPASSNRFSAMALPDPLNKNMAKPERAALSVYRAAAPDLFVSPLGYQLCDQKAGIYWPSGSTRAYSRIVFTFPPRSVPQPVVIIQDTFEGTNYSHFLFDWLPRLCHFIAAGIEKTEDLLFLMGGAPNQFHLLLIDQLCAAYSLDAHQFVFPDRPELWRLERGAYFFSDVRVAVLHPAHMAHERSMDVIRRLVSGVQAPARQIRRLYISRGDAQLRQVANEAELWQDLHARGFAMVRLADIPVVDQIGLIRGAEVIVAPHGMGLTHIAFHHGQPLIVELHHPSVGTDAYAFIAHALGFRYMSVIGRVVDEVRHGFEIPVPIVSMILAEEGILPLASVTDVEAANLVPECIWFDGTQLVKTTEILEAAPMTEAGPVLRHVRGDGSIPDTNTGWIEARRLERGIVYSAGCDIWIPGEFTGEAVGLFADDLSVQTAAFADLSCRDRWQRINLTGVATGDVANFVLRVNASVGNVIYSRGWRVAAGNGS